MYEIPIQLQTRRGTFFRVELGCKDIIAGHGTGELAAIRRLANHMGGLGRYGGEFRGGTADV